MELNQKVSGPSFEELTMEEMVSIQGSGDVKPETTPACVATLIEAAAESSPFCGAIGAGAATGVTVVLSIKKC
ncbi:mersacidin family lantibiotic [Bacillus sonorensis]|uniref:lichenicidin A2 family type 2 lantibiotic n=1 Tax=Bacillus sonorensis TaxID=119858 RepID=UPI002280F804|nr:mersacidin family lantibiotic [Bacillus sonorensis]MCY8090037.1 mersacidin family lantibiotic [Bacillus sonorensis]MCZ0067073.1 mersacidin family lantibiotic [Bacillus sonorensis]MCZ0095603.1 mersacidin family lantibiotic [Bacillus sonorensis]MEC1354947.1 mersacidin family lantibiotic [Bacillus sonorensis]MEC1427149.1 mersacidin family lantibiotic [Bacillus sonorensis]